MIELSHIIKEYGSAGHVLRAVDDVTLSIAEGEIFGIIGYSGAGKSTLVRCINLLERPTSGTVTVDGRDITALSDAELRAARANIGIIFQHFNLFPSRTVADNVAFPLAKAGLSDEARKARVAELLGLVELSNKASAYPEQLSGGQKQRVAIARALIHNRSILLVDEGTSALDQKNADIVEKSLLSNPDLTLILISHHLSDERKAQFDHVYELTPASSIV